jgi:hypothetical protein
VVGRRQPQVVKNFGKVQLQQAAMRTSFDLLWQPRGAKAFE